MRRLFSPSSTEGGQGGDDNAESGQPQGSPEPGQSQNPPSDPPTPVVTPSAAAAPPPAATVVASATETELSAADLQRQLDEERRTRIERERRVNELEDENHRLKTVTPQPARTPKKKTGLTLLHEEED